MSDLHNYTVDYWTLFFVFTSQLQEQSVGHSQLLMNTSGGDLGWSFACSLTGGLKANLNASCHATEPAYFRENKYIFMQLCVRTFYWNVLKTSQLQRDKNS